jgi:prepilin-type N-terminal cleavage/methylation domain-containing protein
MRKLNIRKGFTLVELMVAAALLLIILGTMIPQFSAIRNSWATTQNSSEIIQNAMVLDDHLNRNLTTAKQITAVSSTDVANGFINFTDSNGISKTYQVSNGYIAFGETENPQPLAGPVTQFKISCYSLNDFDTAITDVNSIRFVKIETCLTNSDSQTKSQNLTTQVFIQSGQSCAVDSNVIDIMVDPHQPNTAIDYIAGYSGCNAVIEMSRKGSQGLLCFKDIVGDTDSQIPAGTKITEAKLKLWLVNHNGNGTISLFRMYVPWTEASTWNSIGRGITPGRNCDSSTPVTVSPGNTDLVSIEIDVTDIVQGWINGDYSNYGFGIINNANNDLQFAATENTTGTNSHTPKLVITKGADNNPKVAVKNTVSYGGSTAIFDSYNSDSGSYGGNNISYNAVVTSNATGWGTITLYSGGTIYGDAYIGPGGNTSTGFSTWGSTITGKRGTLDSEIVFQNSSAPNKEPFNGSTEGDFPSNDWVGGERIINSDHYYSSISIWSSNITINGDVTIVLNGDLNIGTGRYLRLSSGSTLNLYVKGNCNIGGSLNAYNDKLPSSLRIYMIGGNKIFSTYGSGNIYALLDNPNGSISLWGSGQFFGRMKGNSLSGSAKIHVDLDSEFIAGGSSEPQTWTFAGGSSIEGIVP